MLFRILKRIVQKSSPSYHFLPSRESHSNTLSTKKESTLAAGPDATAAAAANEGDCIFLLVVAATYMRTAEENDYGSKRRVLYYYDETLECFACFMNHHDDECFVKGRVTAHTHSPLALLS